MQKIRFPYNSGTLKSPNGGIGRHVGLKNPFLREWGFDSLFGHQEKTKNISNLSRYIFLFAKIYTLYILISNIY